MTVHARMIRTKASTALRVSPSMAHPTFGDNRASSAEFLKWTKVQSCTVKRRTALFSKKAAIYSKQLSDAKDFPKKILGKNAIRYNHPDRTGRFCGKANLCHKLLKSILPTIRSEEH